MSEWASKYFSALNAAHSKQPPAREPPRSSREPCTPRTRTSRTAPPTCPRPASATSPVCVCVCVHVGARDGQTRIRLTPHVLHHAPHVHVLSGHASRSLASLAPHLGVEVVVHDAVRVAVETGEALASILLGVDLRRR